MDVHHVQKDERGSDCDSLVAVCKALRLGEAMEIGGSKIAELDPIAAIKEAVLGAEYM